jgi:hypothetical protein
MAIRYIQSMYSYDAELTHIAVPENGEKELCIMAERIVGSDDLVAIYIPEGTDNVYEPGEMRGCVVGAVRLVPMPPGYTMRDYRYLDFDQSVRWPFGWPCQPVYAPPVSECRHLRNLVEQVFGRDDLFQTYCSRFQRGPFELEDPMSEELNRFFMQFPMLS